MPHSRKDLLQQYDECAKRSKDCEFFNLVAIRLMNVNVKFLSILNYRKCFVMSGTAHGVHTLSRRSQTRLKPFEEKRLTKSFHSSLTQRRCLRYLPPLSSRNRNPTDPREQRSIPTASFFSTVSCYVVFIVCPNFRYYLQNMR